MDTMTNLHRPEHSPNRTVPLMARRSLVRIIDAQETTAPTSVFEARPGISAGRVSGPGPAPRI